MLLQCRIRVSPHAFSIYLIAPTDRCFAVTPSTSNKLSSATSLYETQCNSVISLLVSSWLWSSSSSSILFSTYSPMILSKEIISLNASSRYCLKPFKNTFDNILWPKIPPSESEGSLGPFHVFAIILRQETKCE
ncbi:hypothetical protein AVEN_29421-1 [Araneus ventricosus]|uniref:Uncharacterized protein n=1 Tax=Araneus ventricosus TaxID=182803 RepID=A0A4Y2D0D2_ARAVE|nr:hypothetical protein AVEN_29421-1 [Araneus ventricosus]